VVSPADFTGARQAAETARHLLEQAGARYVPVSMLGPQLGRVRAFLLDHGATAYWALNDYEAMLVINELHRLGLRVPEDVSVVGRWDTPWSGRTDSPLTTISLSPEGIAAAIVEAVRAGRDGAHRPSALTLVQPKLVVRQSAGPAPREGIEDRGRPRIEERLGPGAGPPGRGEHLTSSEGEER